MEQLRAEMRFRLRCYRTPESVGVESGRKKDRQQLAAALAAARVHRAVLVIAKFDRLVCNVHPFEGEIQRPFSLFTIQCGPTSQRYWSLSTIGGVQPSGSSSLCQPSEPSYKS